MEGAIQFFELLTTIAIFTVLVLVGIVLYFAVQIVRTVRNVAKRIERSSEAVEDDIGALRAKARRSYENVEQKFRSAARRYTGNEDRGDAAE